MPDAVTRYLQTRPWVRPLRVANLVRKRAQGHPRWREILGADWPRWEAARAAAAGGPRVLLATSVGGHLAANVLDSALAVALTLRGADVRVLLCDAALPACMACEVGWYPRVERFVADGPRHDLCRQCCEPAAAMHDALGIRIERYGALLDPAAHVHAAALAAETPADAIGALVVDGIPVGEHAVAGALRFFARGTLAGEPHGDAVLRRFLAAALLGAEAVRRLLARERHDAVVAHHGVYVPQGVVAAAARAAGTRVVTWNPAYRRRTFVFSHDDSYHRTMLTEPTDAWTGLAWTPAREAELLAYLATRATGTEDWIWFHERPITDAAAVARAAGLDPARPRVVALTSVVWDAQLHYAGNAYPTMLDWLLATIRWFGDRPDLQLVVRVHPAEVHGHLPSRQPAVAAIRAAFPTLPPNVVVVPPESPLGTYALLAGCNAALIYSTKMGIELAAAGIPTIVAGEAWVRNKGIAIDTSTPAEYTAALARLPFATRMTPADVARARKYAHHFFFRRMIPLGCVAPAEGWPPYRVAVDGLGALEPGRDEGLDVVCDGILHGRPFLYGDA